MALLICFVLMNFFVLLVIVGMFVLAVRRGRWYMWGDKPGVTASRFNYPFPHCGGYLYLTI